LTNELLSGLSNAPEANANVKHLRVATAAGATNHFQSGMHITKLQSILAARIC